MQREIYHPNAHLSSLRNVRRGLRARTRILNAIEKEECTAKIIAEKAGYHYAVVMHHLNLLESEGIVNRFDGRPIVWKLTGAGQKRLSNTS
jgi:DNA-binding transcriptional ArsR family regulator